MVRHDKTNIASQPGQPGKPAAPILHCPSEFCWFKLLMDFACTGMSGMGYLRLLKAYFFDGQYILHQTTYQMDITLCSFPKNTGIQD